MKRINMNLVSDAARAALTNMGGVSGQETDPDLIMYRKLKPGDFPKLIGKFGVENTLAYIAEMEKRLVKPKP